MLSKASMSIDDMVKDSGMLNKKQSEAFVQMLLKPTILPKNLVVGSGIIRGARLDTVVIDDIDQDNDPA